MSYSNINEIMLRRKHSFSPLFFSISSETKEDPVMLLLPEENRNIVYAATVAKNMEALGYIPSAEMFREMIKEKGLAIMVNECVIPVLKSLKGADISYNPMYPNFPKQVMDMALSELYTNAIIHYFTFGEWQPHTNKKLRKELNEVVKLTQINICTEKDIQNLFSNLLNSSVPYSDADKIDIIALSKKYPMEDYLPKFITNRENMAILANIMIGKYGPKGLTSFSNQFKTVTDVLRIMNVRHGDGDPTLKEKVHITNVSRPERKAYLSLIDNCKNAAEDMKINRMVWTKVGQGLHPGEYAKQYPNAYKAFSYIRNNSEVKKVKTYNASVEEAIASDNFEKMKEIFAEKPGMLARNLDRLLRNSANPLQILRLWIKLASKVDPNLIWQVHAHFTREILEKDEENKLRIFVLANKNAKTIVKEDNTKPISEEMCNLVILACEKALKEIYKNKPSMGKVFIDPEIAKCKIPNGTRGAQNASVALAKGSRIPINENANTVRAFVWWTNLNPQTVKKDALFLLRHDNSFRVDIDLSAAMLNENLNLIDRISYYNLKPAGNFAFHSGDITDAGKFDGPGAAEFIDIDINKANEQGIKYICFMINSYTHQTYADMEHIRFGWMEREDPLSGEIFEPKTVKQNVKLTANSKTAIMCLFDVENKEFIWMDEIGQDSFNSYCINNIDTNIKGATMSCYKVIHLEKSNVADVIRINAEARGGEIVNNREEADIVFAIDGDITPMDFDYFSGNLISKEVVEGNREKIKEKIYRKEEVNNESIKE